MKILITGATGLIGSYLINELQSSNELFVFGRTGVKANNFIYSDLSNKIDVSSLPSKIDAVIYLAQSDKFRLFPEAVTEVFYVNTINLLEILDYSRKIGVKKFIYASSGGIYGNSKNFREDLPVVVNNDLGFYLSTKLCSEIITDNFRQYMDIVCLRFFFVYGKGQKRTMLIPRIIDSIKHKKEIVLSSQDGIRINPTHVSDAVSAIIKSLHITGNHKVNVAGPEILTLRQISNIISNKVGIEPIFKISNSSNNDVVGDITLMKKILIDPQVKFDFGVNDSI